MKKLLIILSFFIFFNNYSQTNDGIELCIEYQKSFSALTTELEANNTLDKILRVIGASKNFILIPCDDINNALAVTFKGERYILFDGEFMRKVSELTNSWSNTFILAHEVGHHINGHTRDFLLSAVLDDQSLDIKRQEELEADEFASFIISKLGASYNEIEEMITLISSSEDDEFSTHPSLDKRILAVKKGYNKANITTPDNKISKSNIVVKPNYTADNNSSKPKSNIVVKPNYKNPRKSESTSIGKWRREVDYPLENKVFNEVYGENDPFRIKNLKESGYNNIKTVISTSTGKRLNKNSPIELTLEVSQGIDTSSPNVGIGIHFYNFNEDPFKDNETMMAGAVGLFNYIIDDKHYGTLLVYFHKSFFKSRNGGFNVDTFGSDVYLEYMKNFINLLKLGNKLYIKFDRFVELDYFSHMEEIDEILLHFSHLQSTNYFSIPIYTYEFDLKGSSKALNFN